jgi:TatD DNase family protein
MIRHEEDRREVIGRAFNSGLEALITVASDPDSNRLAIAIAEANDNIYCSVGIHPHEARLLTEDIKTDIKSLANRPKVVAVGETGLDYHYDHSPRDAQRDAFRWHLALSVQSGLPVIIHSREADADTIDILREMPPRRAVLHCFSGSPELLDLAREMGIYVSVAGPVTFPKAQGLREEVRHIPDELLLVETDSPYLAPVPRRGKRNEPAYVEHTAREVAALRGVTYEDIVRITTVNAVRLFGIGKVPGGDNIAYKIRNSLYLNVTNRCSNRCSFCVRYRSDFVKGHNLSLSREPSEDEVMAAIGDPSDFDEVVFCGYGEPTMRLELVKAVAARVKKMGGRVRLNTNGQGSLINGRDIVPELKGIVDEVSVSLDAQDAEAYQRICEPGLPGSYEAVLEFIRASAGLFPIVKATVVDTDGVDVEACRTLAGSLGAELRVRHYDVVG